MASKSILVVGGAGGVGSAVLSLLVGRGDVVEATVLNAPEAASIESRYGAAVKTHIVDLANAERALETLKAVVGAIPTLDAVVLCAAVSPCGPAELTPLSTYAKTYEINCVSTVSVYQAAMPALRKTGGRIVLLGSMAGRAALPFLSAYVATKFALEGLCDVMRREAAPQGVKVSLIQPGGIRTNMVYQQLKDVDRGYAALNDEDRERYGYLYTGFLKTAGESLKESASTPEEVAAIVVEALDASEPEPRYIAGADAQQLLGVVDAMSDRQVDELLSQMFQA